MPDETPAGKIPEAPAAEVPAKEIPVTASPVAGPSLLDKIVQQGNMIRDPSQVKTAKDLVSEFVTQVLDDGMAVGKDTVASIKARIAQIDALLSDQLNEILHDPDFQALEGSWRGLNYLVMNSETGTMLKLRLLNATKKEVLSDLERATEFDQSVLFKKIYEEEYGTFGGSPFSCMVGDYEFGRNAQDIGMIKKLSNVAAAAHAPFIAAASPKLFDWDSFTEIGTPRDLSKGFETAELIDWRAFRESEDSRYVALTLPHILMRLPYGPIAGPHGPNTVPVEEFDFVEDVDGKTHAKYLWGNSAYALAQRITNAFSLYGWTAAIRGVEGGGLVQGLPTHTFKTDGGDIAQKCPTEIAITDRREKELNDLGFISLCHCKGTNYAAFFGGQTTNKPQLYFSAAANKNAQISGMLPYILASSRFAHFIKVIMRDKIGSFLTSKDVQNYLNSWISNYVLLRDDAPQSVKASLPLREARIDVTEIPGKVGCYKAVVFLKPHFQLDELTVSIRLVAELPQAAAA